MPGYNHYADCSCPWCLKFRGVRTRYDATRDNARVSLSELGFNTTWSSCFVRPNAKCPECFKPVFYYSNSFGSSVFFDELGWPWPKHPCTDRRPALASRMASPEPLAGRKRGEISEIGEALTAAGIDPRDAFRERFTSDPWETYVISAVERRGFDNHVMLASLMRPGEVIYATFVSANVTVAVGESVSLQAGWISVLLSDFSAKQFRLKPTSEADYHEIFRGPGL